MIDPCSWEEIVALLLAIQLGLCPVFLIMLAILLFERSKEVDDDEEA